jgi:hypothetical protein
VNVSRIGAYFAVWIFCELGQLTSAAYHASFYPCTVDNACHGPEAWGRQLGNGHVPAWQLGHILGKMVLLAIFGKNVEDAFGPPRYLAFYFAGGFAAITMQTAATLLFGTAQHALGT